MDRVTRKESARKEQKAGVNMEEKNRLTEQEIRKLTKPEMAKVEGGYSSQVDPKLMCDFCKQCFGTKVELMLHMNNCEKNPNKMK